MKERVWHQAANASMRGARTRGPSVCPILACQLSPSMRCTEALWSCAHADTCPAQDPFMAGITLKHESIKRWAPADVDGADGIFLMTPPSPRRSEPLLAKTEEEAWIAGRQRPAL